MNKNSVIVRDARLDDFRWVSDLMQKALEPFYGGDHHAHAKRIFDAHISGGNDRVGFFSFEQRMFILEVSGVRAGMLHLVGKRQSTYKISPLILAPEFRGKGGLGSLLLKHAEKYARRQGARQLYCTVAERNIGAMQFFLGKGFVRAGSSESHYKLGLTETMLYKQLSRRQELKSFDQPNISVLPLDYVDSKLRKSVGEMLLKHLPDSFDGIDAKWVEALFEGYERRESADVNSKYKLIFVALNGKGDVVGVAGATPKKGSPIKIMPFIAVSNMAFEALLTDMPHQLVPYGHKLYIHINPTVEETFSLQRLGWKLDAALPEAYRPGVTTFQWSLNIGENTMRKMRIKEKFFNHIRSGKKTLEVRVGYENIRTITVGEMIEITSHNSTMLVKVTAIRQYENFELMAEKEVCEKIAPGIASKKELVGLLREIYPKHKEKLGVLVLEIKKLK